MNALLGPRRRDAKVVRRAKAATVHKVRGNGVKAVLVATGHPVIVAHVRAVIARAGIAEVVIVRAVTEAVTGAIADAPLAVPTCSVISSWKSC